MMEGPRHQNLHQEWQEPLEERGDIQPRVPPPPRPRGILPLPKRFVSRPPRHALPDDTPRPTRHDGNQLSSHAGTPT